MRIPDRPASTGASLPGAPLNRRPGRTTCWSDNLCVDEGPEPGELPVAAGQALERLLSQENQISDLIAFLAALDSVPFLEALGQPGTHCYVEWEELLGKGSGRADLIVRDESGPMALLEIKVGATQHGDQFARYDSWAKAQTPPASRCSPPAGSYPRRLAQYAR